MCNMLIEYKNVNIYQADKLVLANVDFHVDEGEFVYHRQSGVGKKLAAENHL